MELKIVLTEVEQGLLGAEQVTFSEADAYQLLFDATRKLVDTSHRITELQGHTPGMRSELSTRYNETIILGKLVTGLERVLGIDQELANS